MSDIAVKPELSVDLHPAALTQPPIRLAGMGVVVIRDCYGNEVAIAAALPTGHVTVTTAAMPDFHKRLEEFGVKSRVEVIRVGNL
jgi:hypothetical protein